MDLLKRDLSAGDCYRAAQRWGWAGVDTSMTPIAVSHFGDVFLEAEDGVWYLDLVGGTFTREWDSREHLFEQLRAPEAQARFLRTRELRRILEADVAIEPGAVLVPRVPPSLGGSLAPQEVGSRPMVDAHDFFSQVHERIRELGPDDAVHAVRTDEQGRVTLVTGTHRDAAPTPTDVDVTRRVRGAIDVAVTSLHGVRPRWFAPPPGVAVVAEHEGIAAVRAPGHWHLVSAWLTGSGARTREEPAARLELALRVPADPHEQAPPTWALLVLAKIVEGARRSSASVAPGDRTELPASLEGTGWARPWPAYVLVDDADLAELSTGVEVIRCLQVVSLPTDEAPASLAELERLVDAAHPGDPHLLSPPLLPVAPDVTFTERSPVEGGPPAVHPPAPSAEEPVELLDTSFSERDGRRALELWRWLPGVSPGMRLAGASRFGDLFLEDDDGVAYLDVVAGRLDRRWPSADAMREAVADPMTRERYLRGDLVRQVVERGGLVLPPGSVLVPAAHPALTGTLDTDDVRTAPFIVAQSLAAQLHQKVRQLPPGSRVGRVTVREEDTPPSGPSDDLDGA